MTSSRHLIGNELQEFGGEQSLIDWENRTKHELKYPHRIKFFPRPSLVPKELGGGNESQGIVMNCGRPDCHYPEKDPNYFTLEDEI